MKPFILWVLSICLAAASGCATVPGWVDTDAMPKKPPPPAASYVRPAPAPGSLFVPTGGDLFTDLRAKRVGDIVIVEITENTKGKFKNDTKAEKKTTYSASIPNLLGFEGNMPRGGGKTSADPLISANLQNKSDNKSEIKREDTITASIGCTVVEVMTSGNLRIRGSREVHLTGETQHIILEGIVRTIDLTANNTVLSTQIADAKIYYTGRGWLSDKQRPGWLARLLDHIWPF